MDATLINSIITQGVVVPGISGVTVTSITKTDLLRDPTAHKQIPPLQEREQNLSDSQTKKYGLVYMCPCTTSNVLYI